MTLAFHASDRGSNPSLAIIFIFLLLLVSVCICSFYFDIFFFFFSSPEPLGSQRELIVYPWSGVRPSVRRRSQCSNIFFSETAWPIKAKFYAGPPWEGETKVYINGPGHMTKMPATPIYGKNPSKIFYSRTGGPIFKKLDM